MANNGNVTAAKAVRLVLVLWIALTVLPGCADTGKVIDAKTKAPLANVYVVTLWQAKVFKGIQSDYECFNVELTKTNASGAFSYPHWSGNFNPLLFSRGRSFWFYKKGYRGPPVATPDGSLYVAPDSGPYEMTVDETKGLDRLKYLAFTTNNSDCGSLQRKKEVLVPLFQALYEEAREIGETPEQLSYVSSALYALEKLTLGSEEAAVQRYYQRNREWGVKRCLPFGNECK